MMKLHGHPWSINTRKVLATLAETGQHADLVLVMLPKGEHKQPAHLQLHPFGKVPVLDDDGFVIYESRAIDQHLVARAPGAAIAPATPRGRARVEEQLGVLEAYFAPSAGPLIVERLFRKYLGGAPNTAAIEAGRAGLAAPLDAIERVLATSPYLAGETFTLADLHWLPYLDYLERIGEGAPIAARPHVAAWWARIAARPVWQAVAHTGPQPDAPDATQEAIERAYRA